MELKCGNESYVPAIPSIVSSKYSSDFTSAANRTKCFVGFRTTFFTHKHGRISEGATVGMKTIADL